MNTRHFAVPLLAVALVATSGWSAAADPKDPTDTPRSRTPNQSMMGSQMMSNHMMDGCPMMGQLPPGNEKLAAQMHGEMMKAMGDIMLKYADKIQTPPPK